jgi:hypothetical protein
MGVQLFAGLFHARCRLTPHPVTFAWVPGLNYSDYR